MGIRRVSLRVLIAVLVGMFFVPVLTGVASAADIGSGASNNWRAPWIDAYNRIGGSAAIGYPENDVHGWNNGCIQDYGGGQFVDSALMSPACISGRVYSVVGQHWQFVAKTNSLLTGYPVNDSHRWGSGWTQDFDYGAWGWTLLMRGDSVGQVHAVRTGMRDYFLSQAGALGWLGYPTSDEYQWAGNTRQDFQGGSLVATPGVGIRVLPSWSERSTFYSSAYGPAVYVILGGHSYWVTSADQLVNCYGGWSALREVSADTVSLSLAVYPYAGGAPDCLAPRQASAVNWARSQLGFSGWNGWCERFVEVAYGTSGRYTSAAANLAQKRLTGQLHAGDTNVPIGALAFFAPSWQNGGYGHVMISIGGGTFISTGSTVYVTGLNQAMFGPYAGWAYADASWPGR